MIIRTLDGPPGSAEGTFPATNSNPPPLTFSPDSSMVAVRSIEGDEFGIWDTLTGQRVGTLVNPPLQLGNVAFSPDSRTLLLSDYGNKLLVSSRHRRHVHKNEEAECASVWDVDTGGKLVHAGRFSE